MCHCVLLNLCLIVLGVDYHFIFKHLVAPTLVFFALIFTLILICCIYSIRKDKKIIAARGGIKKIYSEFFDVVREKHGIIISKDTSSAIVTYHNDSNDHIKIEIFLLSKDVTSVTLSILHNGKWVKILNKKFDGYLSGKELIWKIIYHYPDCDL